MGVSSGSLNGAIAAKPVISALVSCFCVIHIICKHTLHHCSTPSRKAVGAAGMPEEMHMVAKAVRRKFVVVTSGPF